MLRLKHYRSSKEKFLYGYYIIFLTAASVGTVLRFLVGQYTIAVLDLLAVFVAIGLIYHYEKYHDVNFSSLLLFWIITPFLFFYIYHLGYGLQLLQIIIIPFAASIVLDTKTFMRHGILFLTLFSIVFGYGLLHRESYPYLQNNIFLIDFGVVFFLALAFSIVYHKSTNQFYTKLEETNKELKQANKEKEYLLNEIHHRVKNNLNMMVSILGLQEENQTSKEMHTFIQQNTLRIKSISLVHELLFQNDNLMHINLAQYIKTLTQHVVHVSHHKNIDVNLNIDNLSLESSDTIHLGIILNELLTNSIKHAFKNHRGNIVISLSKNDDIYKLYYTDSGKGFDNKKMSHEGFGLNLIALSIRHLKGTMNIQTNERFEIIIYFKGNKL